MDYSDGIIRNCEFFTTSELAEKLKMNVQVITRKVQAGEIEAYKIGKEWRIPERSVYEWLERNVNTNGKPRRSPVRQTAATPAPPPSSSLLKHTAREAAVNRRRPREAAVGPCAVATPLLR